jgi:hypothetical protein
VLTEPWKWYPLESLCAVSFRVYSTMPGASIIHDLGEKQSEVKISSVALRSCLCNCEPYSVMLLPKYEKILAFSVILSDIFLSSFFQKQRSPVLKYLEGTIQSGNEILRYIIF